MKNRIIITFSIVFVVNIILDLLLIKFNYEELGIKLSIGLLIGSYIIYFLVNLYLFILKSNHQNINYYISLGFGILVCLASLILLTINVFKDKMLFFPMMYIVSLFGGLINWFICEWKNKE